MYFPFFLREREGSSWQRSCNLYLEKFRRYQRDIQNPYISEAHKWVKEKRQNDNASQILHRQLKIEPHRKQGVRSNAPEG